jgi:chromosome segregation ATPase
MKAVSELLEPIERRLGDLIARLDSVRRDNSALRNQVQQLELDKKALQEKIDTAATRLEVLHDSLPS